MERYIPITRHHILPESWGGHLRPNNVVNLREDIHRSLHQIFSNDTPIQRQRRLLETDKKCMNPEVYLAISNTLKQFEGIVEVDAYESNLFNQDTFISRLKNYRYGTRFA